MSGLSDKKIVLITGAGGGLGRELAKAFCNHGAVVVGLGANEETLQKTADEIGSNRYTYFVVDVRDSKGLTRTVEKIESLHGHIDVAFNNAAVYPKKSFMDETAEEFADAIEVNLVGVANVCKAILGGMIRNGYGRIYNVGSWADRRPIANSAAYSASKGAIHALTKAIGVDVSRHNLDIEVHEWLPGHLNTRMSDYTGMDPAIAAQWAVQMCERHLPDRTSQIFVENQIWEPPKGIKQRLKEKLTFWKR